VQMRTQHMYGDIKKKDNCPVYATQIFWKTIKNTFRNDIQHFFVVAAVIIIIIIIIINLIPWVTGALLTPWDLILLKRV
jgi:hypothetical protein